MKVDLTHGELTLVVYMQCTAEMYACDVSVTKYETAATKRLLELLITYEY